MGPGRKVVFFPHLITTRVADDTLTWLKERSVQERLHPSAFIRRLIEAEARRDLVKQTEGGDEHTA
jgi:hypothetical protein